MVWLTVLLGIVLGFVIAGLKEFSKRKQCTPQTTTTGTTPTVPQHTRYDILEYYRERRRFHRRRMLELSRLNEFSRRRQTTNEKGKNIVESWRKSICGLVTLADKNLYSAKHHLNMKNYRLAIQAAARSVENVARALIHCFGGKPDPDAGQEEALRMLSTRFRGKEKSVFEKAIDTVAFMTQNKKALKYLSDHNTKNELFDEAKIKNILRSSSEIVDLFTRIMARHFAPEIPELQDMVPPNRDPFYLSIMYNFELP